MSCLLLECLQLLSCSEGIGQEREKGKDRQKENPFKSIILRKGNIEMKRERERKTKKEREREKETDRQ